LQVIIHVLDHVFALFQAAERSGHPDLIDQLGHFQKACLETVRRIGLVQMGVEAGQAYDPELHKLQDNAAAVENGLVAETVAAGYTYQGQMLRRPVVALKESLK
jgi:molecular chaperone GrpE (heat shock protein)